jgi:murein DD-endopeptidase MepM/ murein hydrolase activator NlpD
MFFLINNKYIMAGLALVLTLSLIVGVSNYRSIYVNTENTENTDGQKKYIKWVDFSVPYSALKKAIEEDIKSQNEEVKVNFIEILAYISSRNGGNYKKFKTTQITDLVSRLKNKEEIEKNKYFSYYLEAYTAILEEYVGEYEAEIANKDGTKQTVVKYGLKVRHPVGGSYSECDDFGNERSYGFKRVHLGHDLMASVGTTVRAVEEGIVEVMGWNRYGGWRVGIRSFDGKRYYYYAHLRKNTPFAKGLAEGQTVKAGQTIGYVGMTGYSTKENVNNIKTPHLHFGIQLIFDEVQKEGINQIWIDCYQISKLLKNPPAPLIITTPKSPEFIPTPSPTANP